MKTFSRLARRPFTEELDSGPAGSFEAFEIRSSDRGLVRANKVDGELINDTSEPGEGAREIVMVRLADTPHLAFLVAAGDRVEIGMQGDLLRAPILSYRVQRHGEAETAVFRNPLADRYACAPPAAEGPPTRLQLDRTAIGGWEVFRLVSLRWPTLSSAIDEALRSIETVLRAGLGSDALLDWIAFAPVERLATIGQALLRLAPPETMAAIAASSLEHPGLADKLASAWPSSRWTRSSLPELQRWTRQRTQRDIVHVGPELDSLATVVRQGVPTPDPTLHLLTAARRYVAPARGVAILATARNEGVYFVDWIAYHRAIGVEHFFLYSKDNDDDSDQLLSCLAHAGIITYLPNRVESPVRAQDKIYSHAFLCMPEILDYRWTAIIDLDEYIVVDPSAFPSLTAFLELQEARGAEAVALNWRMFGSDGHTTFSDRPLLERITGRDAHLNPFVKVIARTNRIWSTTPHMPIWPDRAFGLAVDACGEPHFSLGFLGGPGSQRHSENAGPAWINHYYSKSFPECVWKFARSSVQDIATHEPRFNNVFIAGFLHDFDGHNQVQDRTILAYAEAAARERAKLMALPGVADAHAQSVRVFCERVGALVRDIPNHADQVPEPVRAAYLDLVARSVAEGIAIP